MRTFFGNASARFCLIAAFCLVFAQCSGSNGAASGDSSGGNAAGTSDSVTLTGTLSVPTASPSVNALVRGGPAFDDEGVTLYGAVLAFVVVLSPLVFNFAQGPLAQAPQQEFKQVQEVMTDEEGGFEVELDPELVEDGDIVMVVAEDAGLETVQEVTVSDEGVVDVGEVDIDDTLAAANFKDQLAQYGVSFTETGVSYDSSAASAPPESFDANCFLDMQSRQWDQADEALSGLGGNLGIVQKFAAAAIASGAFADYGYATPAAFVAAAKDGELNDEAVTALAAEAASLYGGSAGAYASSYAAAAQEQRVVRGVYASFAAGSVDGFCGDADGDPDLLEETISVMLASDDLEQFTGVFGTPEGASAYYDFMQSFRTAEGDYQFGEGATGCELCASWQPAAVMGLFGGYVQSGGDYSSFGTYSDDFEAMISALPRDVADGFDYQDWGVALASQYHAAPDGFDAAQYSGFWTYEIQNGLEIDALDPAQYDFGTAYSSTIGSGDVPDFSACLTTPDGCVTGYSEEEFQLEDATYYPASDDPGAEQTDPADYGFVAYCGNAICEAGEVCDADCGTTGTASGQDFCGDAICSPTEVYSCYFDCGAYQTAGTGTYSDPGASSSGYGICGNGACEYMEIYSCYTDCD